MVSPTPVHRTAPLLVEVAGGRAPHEAEAQQEAEVPYATLVPLYVGRWALPSWYEKCYSNAL